MDQKIEVKEEPVWLEGTASTSFDNCVRSSDEMHLKQETKSEPGQTQDNYELTSDEMHLKEGTKPVLAEPGQTQPSTDFKEEISIDEPTVGQLVACLKEEDKLPVLTSDSTCRIFEEESDLMCHLPPHDIRDRVLLSQSGERPIHPISELILCCNEYFRKFSQKPGFRKYLLSHSTEGTHLCNVCGNKFSTKAILKSHRLSHKESHLLSHKGKRLWCSRCGESFQYECMVARHITTHSREGSHVCKECGKTSCIKSRAYYTN